MFALAMTEGNKRTKCDYIGDVCATNAIILSFNGGNFLISFVCHQEGTFYSKCLSLSFALGMRKVYEREMKWDF